MSPLLAVAIIAFAVAVAVTLMLLVRRFAAPAGGFFHRDPDRAAGVFGVTGTGFAVLLAFVIFLSFTSFDRAREKASVEAVAISQLFRIANLFPTDSRQALHGELICYARAVVHDEWKAMRDGRESPLVNNWLARIEGTVNGVQLDGDKQHVAYHHWFEQSAERREGRRGRLTEAEPLVPALVWLALFLGSGLIIAYLCFYADPAERAVVQALMIGAVTTMAVAGLLVVRFLDKPYENGSGGIKPTAMTTTLQLMEAESPSAEPAAAAFCDVRGQPRSEVRLTRSARHSESSGGALPRR
jgi:hypothetical protein